LRNFANYGERWLIGAHLINSQAQMHGIRMF
jgi:hypothetical protein